MKRAAILLVFVAGIAFAAGTTIELSEADVATCNKEGGCKLITNQAYDVFVKELAKLHAIIAKMKKEQCA
jgi:hypothetical protein